MRTDYQRADGDDNRQREALVMLALEGRSYEEIAARLDATPGAVSQLLNRARQSLNDSRAAI